MTTSCADSKDFIIDGETVTVEPYGWADYQTMKHDSIIYKVSVGNVVWSCLLVQTVVASVVFTGWYLYEPVEKKISPLKTAYLTSYGEYCDGWEDGYKEGWCYGKGMGCFDPIVPVCPVPRYNERNDSYRDGYNRGFTAAQRKRS
jgi:hypothetical protein